MVKILICGFERLLKFLDVRIEHGDHRDLPACFKATSATWPIIDTNGTKPPLGLVIVPPKTLGRNPCITECREILVELIAICLAINSLMMASCNAFWRSIYGLQRLRNISSKILSLLCKSWKTVLMMRQRRERSSSRLTYRHDISHRSVLIFGPKSWLNGFVFDLFIDILIT